MAVFHFPVKIISADGCLSSLPDEVGRLGSRNPLVITDPGIVAAGVVDKVTAPLKGKGVPYAVFEEVQPDPEVRNVSAAVERIKKGDHDLLIGLGGGSSMDTAKAASILAMNNGDLREFQGPREAYPKKPLPVITVPTTAGTGSEVSSASMIVDEKKKCKIIFKSPQIFAQVAFLDAGVLAGIPSPIAASTGADTLVHALESFFNPNRSFATEGASLNSVELVFKHLRAFVANTRNHERAQHMLNASALAGIGMTTAGLGLVHAMAHPVGILGKISHGMACALLLPPILRFNCLANADQYQRLALSVDWTIRMEAAKERDVACQVIEEVETLLQDIGLPRRLSELNVSIDNREALIEEASTSYLNQINPRQASRKQVEEILMQIM